MAKVPLHVGEVLVGLHHAKGIQLISTHTGAQHVDPIESRLGVDGGLSSGNAEAPIADHHIEVLGHLVAVDHLAHPHPDLVRPRAGGLRLRR